MSPTTQTPFPETTASMFPRVHEAEVMDTEAEARDYDAMDFTEVNRTFVGDFLDLWNRHSLILDVCTGTARIPIELCCQRAKSRVMAIDLADHMLAFARRNIEAAGLTSRIVLAKADAKQLSFPTASFGAVLCNGSVHHIPDPMVCFAEMHRVCTPGGMIFVRDLLRPDDESALELILNAHMAGANDHQRAMFAASLRASLTLEEVRVAVGTLGYEPEAVEQTSDRHWTWSAIHS